MALRRTQITHNRFEPSLNARANLYGALRRPQQVMTTIEATKHRSAAVAELLDWFEPEQANFRTDEADGNLILIARVSAPKARPIVTRVLRRHFPDVDVRFET
jgi:hypothetical protein